MDDALNVPRWHAPHPADQKRPLCGTASMHGGPTHRVSVRLATTCKRCLKLKAASAALPALGPNVADKRPVLGSA